MTNNVGNVGLASSDGDTTLWFTVSIEQEKIEWVTLNIVFSVLMLVGKK